MYTRTVASSMLLCDRSMVASEPSEQYSMKMYTTVVWTSMPKYWMMFGCCSCCSAPISSLQCTIGIKRRWIMY